MSLTDLDDISLIHESYNANTLIQMLQAAGIKTVDGRGKRLSKADLLPLLQEQFFTAARVQAAWQQLSPLDQELVRRLQSFSGPVITWRFRHLAQQFHLTRESPPPTQRIYGPPMPYIGDPKRADSPIFEDALARLTYWGLVFSLSDSSQGKLTFSPGAQLYLPELVRRHLPPAALADTTQVMVAATAQADPDLFLRDLYLYWEYVLRQGLPLTQAGLVNKRALKAVNAILLQPEPDLDHIRREDEAYRLYLLRTILTGVNLVEEVNGRLEATASPADPLIPAWWSLPREAQLAACLNVWEQATMLREVAGGNYQIDRPNYGQGRQALLNFLKTHPADQWVDRFTLLTTLQNHPDGFLFPPLSPDRRSFGYSGLYYENQWFDLSRSELFKQVIAFETSFLDRCLDEVLYPLGVIEHGAAINDAPEPAPPQRGRRAHNTPAAPSQSPLASSFIRLTPLGQTLFQAAPPPPAAPTAARLVVQPNFQIMALGPVPLIWMAQIDRFAVRQSVDRGAVTYQLTRESVYQAQKLGLSLDQVMHFLEEHTASPLPQNVQRSLQEWGAAHERITFRLGVTLLQADSPARLTQLLEHPALHSHKLRPLTPTLAVSAADPALPAALAQADVPPVVWGNDPAAADHSVILDEAGNLRPLPNAPHLYVASRLNRLAETLPDGSWRITAATVGQISHNRSEAEALLAELQRLLRGNLPPALEQAVKAWSHYFGAAHLEQLTLVELDSMAILEELLQQPALKELLRPLAVSDRALAVGPAAALNELQVILKGLGLQLRGPKTHSSDKR